MPHIFTVDNVKHYFETMVYLDIHPLKKEKPQMGFYLILLFRHE